MKTLLKLIAIAAFVFIGLTSQAQLDVKHYMPPVFGREDFGCHFAVLSTPSITPFNVTITDGSGTLITTVSISSATSVSVPMGCGNATEFLVAEAQLNTVLANKGYIFEGPEAFYVNFRVFADPQAASITSKGRNASLGTDFRTGHMYNHTGNGFRKSNMFGIMATEDNTTITIDDISLGVIFRGTTPGGSPLTSPNVTVVLQEGETYVMSAFVDEALATNNVNGVNGTHITSDKPVCVNSGTWLGGNAITGGGATLAAGRDIGVDQIVPADKVGDEYVLIKGEGIDNEKTMVIGTVNGTDIFLDGNPVAVATINAGDYYVIDGTAFSANDNLYLQTSQDVFVYQMANGGDGATDDNERQCGLNFLPPVGCSGSKDVRLPNVDSIGTAMINIIANAGANVYVNGILQGAGDAVIGTANYVTYKLSGAFSGDVQVSSDDLARVALINLSGDVGAAGYFSGFTKDVTVQTETINSDDIALEGCIAASFTFSIADPSATDTDIDYQVMGTATNGIDYHFIDTTLTIPAGQTSASIIINAIQDGILEGQETIYIIYQPDACSPIDTAVLYIDDAQPIQFDLNGTDLTCHEDSSGIINVNATGGFPAYTYEVTDSLGNVTNYNSVPILNQVAGEYTVQVYDQYGCKAVALVIGGAFDAGQTFLPDGSGVTYTSDIIISGFDPGATLDTMSQLQQICASLEHSYLGDLSIRIYAPSGETVLLKQYPGGGSCDLGEPVATAPVDGAASSTLIDPGVGYDYCWNETPAWGTMVAESNTWIRNYTDSQGNNYTDNYLIAGAYTSFDPLNQLLGADLNGTWTLEVTDNLGLDNGYIFEWNISLLSDLPDTTVVIEEPDGMDISGFITQATCGGADGAINIDVLGEHVPFTYLWSNGATTEDISGLIGGTYTVWVTDTTNCVDSATFLLNNISSMNMTYTSVDASCAGGTDASVDITISGGTSPYNFSWSHGPTTEDITGVSAGTYTVTITDASTCVFSQDVTVGEMPAISVSLDALLNEICGTGNGSISITATGGTGSYGYSWSNGPTTDDITGLSGGAYDVTVTDGNGCTGTGNYTVLNDVSSCSSFCYLDLTGIISVSDTCGSGVGSIDITVSDPVNPYNVNWDHGPTTEDLSNLTSGTYTVHVNDANGCEDSAIIVVSNYSGTLAVSAISTMDETCGDGAGAIDITVTGGALPYSFSWSNAETSEDITGLSAGQYIVNITDGAGCMMADTVNIGNNAGTMVESGVVAHDTCVTGIGAIDLSVAGGNAPLAYSWNSGPITQDLSGLLAGSYICTITDASGCVLVSNSYNVNNNSGSLSLDNVAITNEQCGNGAGAIDLTVSGGTAPVTFAWSNTATSEDLTGLSAGAFDCTISDAIGCTVVTGTLDVFNSPSTLSISTNFITDEICGNAQGAINIDVTGGTAPYTFSWTGGSTSEDLLNASAGTYTVTVTDAAGCATAYAEVINNIPGTLSIDNAILTDENCGDGAGAIDLIISGGTGPYTYLWSNAAGTEDISSLSAGTYSVDVTDANGCAVNGSYVINNAGTTLAVTPTITSEICSNGLGSITLSVTGGSVPYTFLWNTTATSQDLVGIGAGIYSCVITDLSGCSINTGNITVVNNPGTLAVTGAVVDDTCSASIGAIDITVTGASGSPTYLWSTSDVTEDISGITAGSYNVTVTDAAGCVAIFTNVVNNSTGTLSYDNAIVTNEVCNDNAGAIDLVVSGGSAPVTFLWSTTATSEDLTGLTQGTFSCDITDNNGCTINTGSIIVSNDPGTLSLDNVNTFDEQCGNGLGSINITVSGGVLPYTFLWNTAATTEDLNSLSAGIYTCVVTDASGCTLPVSTTVGNNSGVMAVSTFNVTDEACGNGAGAIDITVVGGALPIIYLWSNSATTEDISGLSAGTYSVQITDNNGCTTTFVETVLNAGGGLAISGATVSNEICGNAAGAINITIAGGTAPLSFLWSNSSIIEDISGLTAGSYSVDVTDNNGCTVSGAYTLINNAGTLALDSVNTIDESCGNAGGAVDIFVSGGNLPLTYSWNSGQTTEDIGALGAGSYSVDVTDNFGCVVSSASVIANITGGFGAVVTSVTDESCGDGFGAIDITVSGGFTPYTFAWSNADVTEDISGLSAGSYSVTITDNVGCSATMDTVVLNQTTGLSLVSSLEQNENCGDSTGFIDLVLSGGSLPYNFVWSNGATTEDVSGLTSGIFTCVITDASGCVVNYSGTISNNGGSFVVSDVIVDEMCDNDAGSVTVTVSGGISPYTFTWTGGAANVCCDYMLDMNDTFGDGWNGASVDVEINGTPTGSYSVPGGGSVASETFQVCNGDNVELFWTAGTFDNEVSFNLLDPAGATIFTQGVNPTVGSLYVFTGSCPGAGSNVSAITGLNPGIYGLTITDDVGCSYSDSYEVDSAYNFALAFSTVTVTDAICGSGGDLSVTATGGTFYTYYLDGVSTTFPFWTGIGAGTYNVVIEDENGCTVEQDITINDALPFTAIFASITDEDCGLSNGAIDVLVTPVGAYNYLWNTAATTQDLTGIMSGIYSVDIDDGAGCTTTLDTVILNIPGFNVSAVITDENCGDGVGAIDITMSIADAYTFSWSNGATTEDLAGLSAGSYSVDVTNSTGCVASLDTLVNNTTTGIGITGDVIVNETCGDSTGTINISVAGGSLPYTFLWSDGQTVEDPIGLTAGTYTCVATDATGCAVNYSGVMGSTDSFTVSDVIVDEMCDDDGGSIEVTVSGGVAPYTFTWTGATGQACCDYTLDMFDASTSWNGADVEVLIDGSSIGNFTVLGGGANMETFEVCDGENVELIWSAGAFDNEVSFNLLDPSGAVIFAQGPNPPVGSLFIFAGACSSSSSTSVSGLSGGSYDLTIEDAAGCAKTITYFVDSLTNPALGFSSVVLTDDNCGSAVGAIDVTAIGGTTYNYYLDGVVQPSNPMTGLLGGTYTIMIEDENGCTATSIQTVVNALPFTPSFSSITDEDCGTSNGAIDVNVSPAGSYTFNWNTGATTEDLTGIMSGTYSVIIDDGAGCTISIDTVIVSNPGFTVSAVVTDENCGDTTGAIDITMSAVDTYTFAWSNGATTEDLLALSGGLYSVDVMNSAGCTVTLDTTVANISTGVVITSDVIVNENCGDSTGVIDLTISGGSGPYTYLWSDGQTTEDAVGLTSGNYICTVTDFSGCAITYSGTMGSDDNFTVVEVIVDEMCNDDGGSIDVTVTGGSSPYTYSWIGVSSTSSTVTGLSAGFYTITIEDATGCTSSITYEIDSLINPALTFATIVVTDDNCGGGAGSIDAVAIGGVTYTYYLDGVVQTGNPITGLATGTYTVMVEDESGCTISTTQTVGNVLTYAPSILSVTDDYCNASTGAVDIDVTPIGTYTFTWSNGATTEDLSGVIAGSYSVTIDDGSGCIGYLDTIISNTVGYTVSATSTNEFCSDTSGMIDLTVTGGTGPFSYSWDNGEATEDLDSLGTGAYVVTVTDLSDGCVDTLAVLVGDSVGFTTSAVISADSCMLGVGSIDLTVVGGTGPFTYDWTTTETTEDVGSLASGSYSVTVIDQGSGCTQTFTYLIPSTASFGLVPTITDATCPTCADGDIALALSGTPTGPFTVSWNNGDTTFNIITLLPGWYTVTVTDALGCALIDSFEVTSPTLIIENDNWSMNIYPNPTNGAFNVLYNLGGTNDVRFEIYDLIGQLIESRKAAGSEGAVRFDLNGEQTGTFYLRVTSGDLTKTYKLILMR
ncbi:MAG: subtilisin-like proprotein convertase family protein/uncharacterized protein affecting Mg2+ [Parvicellaceae bacterium]|jgi:subtilisin-like proprotein convertase family protein/uncharacterized protein affecting Mg2+/Co2+ transport